jgi:hypothetical protein
MKLWRWFVGQVERLRRSVVGGLASDSQPLHADDHLAFEDERAHGPPAHWVERVRNGAPGLLEPSLRRPGEPAEPPPANRVALSQTELGAEPESLEEPERGYVRNEPPAVPERTEGLVRAPLLRKVRARRLLQVFRRTESRAASARAAVSPVTSRVPPRIKTAARRVGEPRESQPAEPDRRHLVGERGRTPAPPRPRAGGSEHSEGPVPDKSESKGPPVPDKTVRFQGPPIPDKPEHSTASEPERLPGRSEVVAFEAPLQRRVARVERATSPAPPLESGVTRPSAKGAPRAELAGDEITDDLFWEQAVHLHSPPRRGVERMPRLPSPRGASVEPGPSPRHRAEPLSEAAAHPWPELPAPLDQPDGDVETALRAWEHQRRLDLEQTRL